MKSLPPHLRKRVKGQIPEATTTAAPKKKKTAKKKKPHKQRDPREWTPDEWTARICCFTAIIGGDAKRGLERLGQLAAHPCAPTDLIQTEQQRLQRVLDALTDGET